MKTMNPLQTLQIFSWVGTQPFSTNTTGINLAFQKLHTLSFSNIHPWIFPFHQPYFSIIYSADSPHRIRPWAYCNSNWVPFLKSYVSKSVTINSNGLNTDRWWTPTWTTKDSDNSPSTDTAVLQSFYNDMIPWTKFFGSPFILKTHQVTFCGTRLKAFSRSTNT